MHRPLGRRARRNQAFASPVAHSEAFRILRTNLDVALANIEHPMVIVTSANPGEGKTATAVNLARSLTLAGRRIVLVDLDLRHPDTHRQLGTHNDIGVSEVLSETRTLAECLQYVPVKSENRAKADGLYFLATGRPVPDPAELLDGPRTGALLRNLAEQADLVLIDTPPLLPVADTLVIGRRVSGAILVVEIRRTAVGAVEQAKNALTRNETPLFGVVVNKLQLRDARQAEAYGYGYGYGYGQMTLDAAQTAPAMPALSNGAGPTRETAASGRAHPPSTGT